MKKGLTFDDVLLIPQKSIVSSRKEIEIGTRLIASNMESVTNKETIVKLWDAGANGVLHRFDTFENRLKAVKWLKKRDRNIPILVSIGTKDAYYDVQELIDAGAESIFIDVANAYSEQVLVYVNEISQSVPDLKNCSVVIGNIATPEAAKKIMKKFPWINGLKVGIGPGSACTTRLMTGVGYPQLSTIMEIYKVAKKYKVNIISDGGIAKPADFVKAIVAGADYVMMGKEFARTRDNTASNNGKEYYGSSSEGNKLKNNHYEGAVFHYENSKLPSIGEVIKLYNDGLTSAISYLGEKCDEEIKGRHDLFIEVTPNTLIENKDRK